MTLIMNAKVFKNIKITKITNAYWIIEIQKKKKQKPFSHSAQT